MSQKIAVTAATGQLGRLVVNEVGRRVPQHTNVVEAAKDAGVSFIGYTSAPKASDTDLILAPEHKATEEVVQASGIPYSIMRNNWYMENYGATIDGAKATGEIISATQGARIPG